MNGAPSMAFFSTSGTVTVVVRAFLMVVCVASSSVSTLRVPALALLTQVGKLAQSTMTLSPPQAPPSVTSGEKPPVKKSLMEGSVAPVPEVIDTPMPALMLPPSPEVARPISTPIGPTLALKWALAASTLTLRSIEEPSLSTLTSLSGSVMASVVSGITRPREIVPSTAMLSSPPPPAATRSEPVGSSRLTAWPTSYLRAHSMLSSRAEVPPWSTRPKVISESPPRDSDAVARASCNV